MIFFIGKMIFALIICIAMLGFAAIINSRRAAAQKAEPVEWTDEAYPPALPTRPTTTIHKQRSYDI